MFLAFAVLLALALGEAAYAGHGWASSLSAGPGSEITAISVSLAMARLVQFLAAMILLGASLFPVYAFPPAAPAGMMQLGKMVPRTVVIAAFAAVLSALAWAAASIAGIAGDVDGLFDAETLSQYFFETSFGKVWLFRIAAAIALLLAVVLRRRHLFARNGSTVLVAVLAAALLASQAWIGHPASLPAPQRWFVTAAYVLHVFAAAIWLGALLPLGLLVKRALHEGTPPQLAEFALRRFSPVGMAAVGMILLGGLINALSRMVSFEAFVTSTWGQIIILKFVIVSAMIAVAALNRFVLMPLLPERAEIALPKLARNIAIEQAALLLVLAASAFLAVFHPPGMTGMTH
ncbi:MAG: CopD family protein [Beijerinckiaceae bacterium]|nr:CopD family protein [Beijerinckiaceae bacterium]